MPPAQRYTLTETAERDLLETRRWSEARWGKKLTRQYFQDLHEAANYCALNQPAIAERDDLTGGSGLFIHPVREHYLIFIPKSPNHIIIVSILRQGRDIPEILKRASFILKREIERLNGLCPPNRLFPQKMDGDSICGILTLFSFYKSFYNSYGILRGGR